MPGLFSNPWNYSKNNQDRSEKGVCYLTARTCMTKKLNINFQDHIL